MTPRTAAACSVLFLLAAAPTRPKPADVQLEMKNVRLHVTPGIVLEVSRLRGVMISRNPGAPPVFDDPRSYVLHVQRAEMALDMKGLEGLLNQHVLAYDGVPLKDVRMAAEGTRLKLRGKLRKGIDVPFSTVASISVTADGRLRLHADSMKAAGIPAGGLLGLFGLKLDDVVSLRDRIGVEVHDDDIIIAPGQILPPPRIAGRLSSVRIRGDRLVQTFDDAGHRQPARLLLPSPGARNYIYFGGGDITFGKLTMHGADLQLIDSDPKDPFDFFPGRYNAQLVAGYSKNTPSKGLKTFMPDFDDLGRAPSTPARR